ncbi:MAG: hypothetical protein Q9220_006737 [cf. Caloplaca sp. 1 TL-2023]
MSAVEATTSGPPPTPPTSKPFPFFALPLELRSRILSYLLCPNSHLTIDLDPSNHHTSHPRLSLFLVSKQFGYESYHIFYSHHTFRIFQTHDRFLSGSEQNKMEPLLARLPSHYRNVLVSLELRLGPRWTNPPKAWVVSDRLGLEECVSVRTLRVFVQVDPSSPIFKGFRLSLDFFTDFSGELLREIIKRLPVLETVEFDAYPSVDREGKLMTRLLEETRRAGKKVGWGKEREWGDSLADRLEVARLRVRQLEAEDPIR